MFENFKSLFSIKGFQKTQFIAMAGIIAAVLVVLKFVFQPISFGQFQFHIATLMLGAIVIYPRSAIVGQIIGTFIGNAFSPLGVIDLLAVPVFFGTNILMALWRDKWFIYIGGLISAFVAGIYVAYLLNWAYGLPIPILIIEVFIPEALLSMISITLWIGIKKGLPEAFLWED